jgi:hypothetical protein
MGPPLNKLLNHLPKPCFHRWSYIDTLVGLHLEYGSQVNSKRKFAVAEVSQVFEEPSILAVLDHFELTLDSHGNTLK